MCMVCMHVCVPICVYMGVHAWIGVCLWKPEVDVRNLPRLLYSFEEESVRSIIKSRAC